MAHETDSGIMARMSPSVLTGIIALLLLSVLAVAAMRRIHLPPIIGYLLVGAVFGPHALALIPGGHTIEFLAELGVVFLLFMIGLEVSISHLLAMRRILLGLGGLQVLLSTLATVLLAIAFGLDWRSALAIGGALSLSSTAIVVKQLQEQLEMHSRHGRKALGILLFQDLAVVPFLVLIPILGAGGGELGPALLLALGKAVLAFALMFGIGHWLLRPVLGWVAAARSIELFTLAILLLALAAAWLTRQMGLSLALGAFLAGVMLAETEYRHQIETEVRPFRDVLLGLFFVTVGAQLDPAAVLRDWPWVLLLTAGVVLGKGGLIVLLTRLYQSDWGVAIRTGAVLAQGGEFGFALLALALAEGLVDGAHIQPLLAALVLSMLLAPILIRYNGRLAKRLSPSYNEARLQREMAIADEHARRQGHVIICGFGRVGQNLARFLREEDMDYLALDVDTALIREAFEAGEPVHFGDSSHPEILEKSGIDRAAALVVTFHDYYLASRIVQTARRLAPELPIVVRTRNDHHMEDFEQLGASTVVPESLESSLIVAARTLELLGIDHQEVERLIEQTRAQHYAHLRGVFRGEQVELEDELDELQLHPLSLHERAAAIGLRIDELGLDALEVTVEAVRRSGVRGEQVDPGMRLREGDTLVLQGRHEQLRRAEQLLLNGV
jgi:CPA2 family monovalent cation:H+ antiporter-2